MWSYLLDDLEKDMPMDRSKRLCSTYEGLEGLKLPHCAYYCSCFFKKTMSVVGLPQWDSALIPYAEFASEIRLQNGMQQYSRMISCNTCSCQFCHR